MNNIYKYLSNLFHQNASLITEWFSGYPLRSVLYSSTDIRNAGFKIAPVDTNAFPAGFNNINAVGIDKASTLLHEFVTNIDKKCTKILLLAENHTRNIYYLDNITSIKSIIQKAGFEVLIGIINDDIEEEKIVLQNSSNQSVELHKIIRDNDAIKVNGNFYPDLIISNNDLTGGTPEKLRNITQYIYPSTKLGWHTRRKTTHFDAYRIIIRRFCNVIDLDPWLISALFNSCGTIDFKQQKGIDCIANNVDKTITRIQNKYDCYDISETPYVYVKSNMGTYGLGVMLARSGQDIININKKIKNKMQAIKGGTANSEVIIQEGVPTTDNINGQYLEHMVYTACGEIIGYLQRRNKVKDQYGNLNSASMNFAHNSNPEQNMVNNIIAKLSMAALLWECYEEDFAI